jgi:2-iminobutanoate/2-iminopropanoate deaminase
VYGEYYKEDCPARAAFAVKDLPMGALVEIETIAVK